MTKRQDIIHLTVCLVYCTYVDQTNQYVKFTMAMTEM